MSIGESTIFCITTTRHASEETALVKAMAVLDQKLAAHSANYPKDAVVSVTKKFTYVASNGHSATIIAVTGSLQEPDSHEP